MGGSGKLEGFDGPSRVAHGLLPSRHLVRPEDDKLISL